jgi:glycosyltransferase involved in cell wall biosynthesis
MNKVFIDGLGLVDGHFSGVGQYILGILQGLDSLIEDKKYKGEVVPEIYVIIPYDTLKKFKSYGFKHIGYKKLPFPFRLTAALWHRGKMPPIDLLYGKGAYIFPRFVSMPLLRSKFINVVYDLSFELHREYSDEKNALFLSDAVRKTVSKSSKVITISKSAKSEIIKFYNLPENKVVVAYPATDPNTFYRRSQKEINKVKNIYGIEGDYILALSNLEPRKNLSSLIEAYDNLPIKIRKRFSLLLVGVKGWKADDLFQDIVRRVDDGSKIIRPSKYVSDNDKPALISGASLLVYPSHYEGFGMPPLEALACGVPVITANNSSLPEVVGKLSPMIDSRDVGELTKMIATQLDSIKPISEKMLVEGPKRAENFSWVKSAEVFLNTAGNLYQ